MLAGRLAARRRRPGLGGGRAWRRARLAGARLCRPAGAGRTVVKVYSPKTHPPTTMRGWMDAPASSDEFHDHITVPSKSH